MKNLVLPIAVLVFSSTLYGQYDHNIHFTNGNTITHNVTQIDSISFSTDGLPVMHLNLLDGSTNDYSLSLINQVIFSGDSLIDLYPPGTIHCISGGTQVIEVLHPLTGRIWMDRNLGASQAATASNDEAAYGDLYQWGRFSDGHQCRTSGITNIFSSTSSPAHGDFINIIYDFNFNWLSPVNANLWQGVSSVNNPCPEGFRLPTSIEWSNERESWISNDTTGAIASLLKLPAAGFRIGTGEVISTGFSGEYWSSTVSNIAPSNLIFSAFRVSSVNASVVNMGPSSGLSVRCIKNLDQDVGQINSLDCGDATLTGTLTPGLFASNVSISIPYTGGNGGFHDGQAVLSSGITGLTAILSAGNFNDGAGSLTYSISGAPLGIGAASFALNIGGQDCALILNIELAEGNISSLECENAEHTGILTPDIAVSGVSSSIPYAWGNGEAYDEQVILSNGVTGLTATLNAGSFNNGPGTLTCTITGTPQGSGLVSFDINIGNQTCTLNRFVSISGASYPNNTIHCIPSGTIIAEVLNPVTGRIWMDRNLGASQVATSSTDSAAYGDLYQWGRFSDGHHCRTSPTTIIMLLSTSDSPEHGMFILPPVFPRDWRIPQNDNLWQGSSGANNPCPIGFRLPTEMEWDEELESWTAGAFESPLKLTEAGSRNYLTGGLNFVGFSGYYWSSTISASSARVFGFEGDFSIVLDLFRSIGNSVRCIKD